MANSWENALLIVASLIVGFGVVAIGYSIIDFSSASVVDAPNDGDTDDSGAKLHLIESFETGLLQDYSFYGDGVNDPRGNKSSIINIGTDGEKSLNLTNDGNNSFQSASLLADSEDFEETPREGDIVKWDTKVKTGEQTGVSYLLNLDNVDLQAGSPSNQIITYVSQSSFQMFILENGSQNPVVSKTDPGLSIDTDEWLTVKMDLNSDSTPENVYKAELLDSDGNVISDVNGSVQEGFFDSENDDFAFEVYNSQDNVKYSYFDNLRVIQ
jgi:hypothetical protein